VGVWAGRPLFLFSGAGGTPTLPHGGGNDTGKVNLMEEML
jgi:hypothetical protein